MPGTPVRAKSTMLPVSRHVRTRARIMLAAGFAFTTGWTDAICLMRWKAFTTMMTGNMILIGYRIAESRSFWATNEAHVVPDWFYHFCIVLTYFAGIVLYRFVEKFLPFWTGTLFAPVAAVCVTVVEVLRLKSDSPFAPHRWDAVMLAPIFAVQSAVSVRGGLGIPTTMLTGHLQNLGFSLVHCVLRKRTRKERKANFLQICVIVWLCVGAFCGALVVTQHSREPTCSAHPTCVALQLEGSCCPTPLGLQLDCCSDSEHVSISLLPVAPLLAIMLVAHDILFRPLQPPDSDLSSGDDSAAKASEDALAEDAAEEDEEDSDTDLDLSPQVLSSSSENLEEDVENLRTRGKSMPARTGAGAAVRRLRSAAARAKRSTRSAPALPSTACDGTAGGSSSLPGPTVGGGVTSP